MRKRLHKDLSQINIRYSYQQEPLYFGGIGYIVTCSVGFNVMNKNAKMLRYVMFKIPLISLQVALQSVLVC